MPQSKGERSRMAQPRLPRLHDRPALRPIFADAVVKGQRNFDVAKAYGSLRKSAFEPPATGVLVRRGLPIMSNWVISLMGPAPTPFRHAGLCL